MFCASQIFAFWLGISLSVISANIIIHVRQRPNTTENQTLWVAFLSRQYDFKLQPLWRNWPPKLPNSVKYHRKITPITPFEVIQGHHFRISRKLVCDFPCLNNSRPNLHLILHYFRDMAYYWSNFPPLPRGYPSLTHSFGVNP